MNGFLKRCFDLVFSLLGLVLISPLLLILGAWIVVEDGSPVFFRQTRVGKNEKPFRIWKFRTMYRDAESRGLQVTVGRDPRITRSGQWIRKYKFDELPQLLNVLFGEMTFVGPRPEVPKYVAMYSSDQKAVFKSKPGITDPASIRYRKEAELLEGAEDPEAVYVNQIMPEKLRINLEYLERASFFTDLQLIFSTVWLVLRP